MHTSPIKDEQGLVHDRRTDAALLNTPRRCGVALTSATAFPRPAPPSPPLPPSPPSVTTPAISPGRLSFYYQDARCTISLFHGHLTGTTLGKACTRRACRHPAHPVPGLWLTWTPDDIQYTQCIHAEVPPLHDRFYALREWSSQGKRVI